MLAFALPLALACPAAPSPHASIPPPGHYAFESYGAENGLQNLAEQALAVDMVGFLWTGSQDGLYRYNGAHFQRFGREQGLPSTYVTALLTGPDGRLSVGTWEGLALWNGGVFTRIGAAEGLPASIVNAIAASRDGRLWIASKAGLFREIGGGRFAPAPGWPGGEPTAIWVDPDGAPIAARDSHIERLDPSGAWAPLGGPSPMGPAPILGIARDASGRLWIHSRTRLAVLAPGGSSFDDRSCLLPSASSEGVLALDGAGQLIVPTAKGVLRVRADDADVVDQDHGLPTDTSFAAFEDREGSLWVASAGLHRMRGRGLWSSYTVREGLPSDVVYSISRGPDRSLWCGTDDGLARATESGWRLVDGTQGHSFRALDWAPDGALWGGGSPGELVRIDPATSKVTTYGAQSGLRGAEIMGFKRDPRGVVWVGTRGGGLFRGADAKGSLTFVPYTLPGGSPDEEIDWVTADAEGRVWAAGERGLGLIMPEGDHRFTVRDGLRANHITGVMVRKSGELCVEYFEPLGLSCFRLQGHALEGMHHIDAKAGLPSDKMYSLGEDRDGHLWAGTATGAARIDPSRVDLFRRSDGAPGDDFDAMAFWADDDGDVWLGTSTGLGRFAGARDHGPPPPPRAVLETVRIGDRLLSEPFPSDVKVPFGDDALDVRFAALGFVNEGRIVSEVRLVGAFDRWSTTDAHEQRFAALSPGSYRFEVRARFGAGDPGEPATFAFQVLPAWWQTWWSRALFVVVAAVAIALGVRARLRSLRTRNAALEELVLARTAELTRALAKVAESERLSALGRLLAHLSHELNNPINVIANNLAPMKDYLEATLSALTDCRAIAEAVPEARGRVDALWRDLDLDFVTGDFGKALKTVELAAGRVRAVHSDLRNFMQGRAAKKVVGDLTVSVKETVEMVRRSLPAGIVIVEDYLPIPEIPFHAGQLNQVFLNLIQNAADAVGERGTIKVSVAPEGDTIQVAIADTGPGVRASARERIFEPFFTTKDFGKGTGLGLAICRQIVVDAHGGTIDLDAEYTAGARFVIRLPLVDAGTAPSPSLAPDSISS
jgi:signal transduction histidine kinase/ligand-binding sensor domain-containing protein